MKDELHAFRRADFVRSTVECGDKRYSVSPLFSFVAEVRDLGGAATVRTHRTVAAHGGRGRLGITPQYWIVRPSIGG